MKASIPSSAGVSHPDPRSRVLEGRPDAQGMRIALAVARFNEVVTRRLLHGAERCLERHGGRLEEVTIAWVPGSWELPLAVSRLARSGRHDAVVALGCLIRGETPHFDHIAAEAARGLGQVSLASGIPVTFGVLTTEDLDQALARSDGDAGNKGWDAALAAIEMVALLRRMA